jgi:hypothetical protein
VKTYYELLGLQPTAEADEVKHAFRREIARYHPDKVQHLGPEFQEIAATRAAELTEAYRILMDPAARKRYDESLADGSHEAPREAPAPAPAGGPSRAAAATAEPSPPPPVPEPPPSAVPESLRRAQETLTQFVRKATLTRLQDSVDALFGPIDPLATPGCDAAYVLKPRRGLFQKGDPPVRLMVRIVGTVNGTAVEEAWPVAARSGSRDEIPCLLLMGTSLATPRELAGAIAEQRRRTRQLGPVLIPVDIRQWDPLLPPETPGSVRRLLERLKLGA